VLLCNSSDEGVSRTDNIPRGGYVLSVIGRNASELWFLWVYLRQVRSTVVYTSAGVCFVTADRGFCMVAC